MKSLSNNTRLLVISLSLVLSLAVPSCIKDHINMDKISYAVDWNPKYGTPLAYGNLSLKDIIESIDKDGVIKEDSITRMLYLTYTSNIFSKVAKDLITIPPQSYQEVYNGTNIPVFPPITPDTVFYNHNSNYTFNFTNGEEVDSVLFKTITLQFRVRSEFKHTGRVWVTMTSFKKNGKPFKIPIKISNLNGTFDTTVTSTLNGYMLGLSPVNQVPFTYDVVLNRNSGQAVLASEKVTIDVQINNAMFGSLFGYIGNYAILPVTTGKINIGLFDDYKSLNVDFSDPRIRLYIANSFGAPIKVQISNVRTWSEKNQHFYDINFTSGNPFIIKAPLLSQIGDTVTTVVQFDKGNSNIFGAIPDIPKYLNYTIGATSNPDGKTAIKNFVVDTSRMDVDFNLELPFNLKASNIQHSDTIFDFDLSSVVSDFSIVKKLALYNTFKNSIPFDLKLQVILKDSIYNDVDSLYSSVNQPIISSGILDKSTNRYIVNPNAKSVPPVMFDDVRAKKLKNVKHAIVRVSLTTVGNGLNYAAFYSDYHLYVAFQVQTELEVKSLNQF